MMRIAALFSVLLLLTGCSSRPTQTVLLLADDPHAAVPLTSEPSHHLVLANDYVRVFRVEAAPGASTLIHRHDNDYFWVAIGASDITNNVVGKPPVHAEVADGEVRFAAGGFEHSVTNNSKQPFRNFTIEILKHGSRTLKPGEDEHEMTLMQNGSIERLLVRDGVRVSEIELKPGASFSRQNPEAALLIPLSGSCSVSYSKPYSLVFSVTFDCSEAPAAADKDRARWQERITGIESFRNAGNKPARLLILDF